MLEPKLIDIKNEGPQSYSHRLLELIHFDINRPNEGKGITAQLWEMPDATRDVKGLDYAKTQASENAADRNNAKLPVPVPRPQRSELDTFIGRLQEINELTQKTKQLEQEYRKAVDTYNVSSADPKKKLNDEARQALYKAETAFLTSVGKLDALHRSVENEAANVVTNLDKNQVTPEQKGSLSAFHAVTDENIKDFQAMRDRLPQLRETSGLRAAATTPTQQQAAQAASVRQEGPATAA